MQYLRIRGANRILAKDQAWSTLHVRAETIPFKFSDDKIRELPTISFAVELSTDEIQQLLNGKPLVVRIIGEQMPPIVLLIGDDRAGPDDDG